MAVSLLQTGDVTQGSARESRDSDWAIAKRGQHGYVGKGS